MHQDPVFIFAIGQIFHIPNQSRTSQTSEVLAPQAGGNVILDLQAGPSESMNVVRIKLAYVKSLSVPVVEN